MKILYIANSRIPTEKAHGLQIMKMSEAFILGGHEVTLLLPRRENHITDTPQEYYSLKKLPNFVYLPNFLGFLENSFHQTYFFVQRIFFSVASVFYGLASQSDLIFSREISVCFFLSFFGKKVVFEDHEPKKRFHFLYKFFIKNIWKKIVVPPALTELYKVYGVDPASYKVCPNGVDLSDFKNLKPDRNLWSKYGINQDKKIALYVGHFYAWKGVYTLIDAAKYLKDIQVVLIGGVVADQKKVLYYIEKNEASNVFCLPFMSHKKVLALMVSVDVLVLPNTAKEERSQRYTTPIKLFEYLASGVPLIASDLPSFRDYLRNDENCLLCEPDSPRDLAEKIVIILSRDDEGRRLAEKAQRSVVGHTWQVRAIKIVSFVTSQL